jgi:hypothetical protein
MNQILSGFILKYRLKKQQDEQTPKKKTSSNK